jgi:outer membrane protein assembly factor BamB
MLQKYDTDGDGFIKKEEIPADMLFFERPEIRDVQHPWYLKGFFGWFDKNNDGLCNEEEWNKTVEYILSLSQDGGLFAIRPDGENELPLTQMLWKVKEKVPEVPSPIYLNGNVYMCKNGGTLTCVNAKEGNILYRERIGASGPYYASPVAANGNIYIASGKGMITVIRAGDKLDIVAQNNLNENIYATPAIVGNTIYVRTTAHLYAFGKN